MNVSCSAIQQMLHYPVNMAVGILNFSLWFLALFFWGGGSGGGIYKDVFLFFSQEFHHPFSVGDARRFGNMS
jgi:hypothetical protein